MLSKVSRGLRKRATAARRHWAGWGRGGAGRARRHRCGACLACYCHYTCPPPTKSPQKHHFWYREGIWGVHAGPLGQTCVWRGQAGWRRNGRARDSREQRHARVGGCHSPAAGKAQPSICSARSSKPAHAGSMPCWLRVATSRKRWRRVPACLPASTSTGWLLHCSWHMVRKTCNFTQLPAAASGGHFWHTQDRRLTVKGGGGGAVEAPGLTAGSDMQGGRVSRVGCLPMNALHPATPLLKQQLAGRWQATATCGHVVRRWEMRCSIASASPLRVL